jgi:hypothetical protein
MATVVKRAPWRALVEPSCHRPRAATMLRDEVQLAQRT